MKSFEMGSMKEAGIAVVSDDGRPVMNSSVMKKAMVYAQQFNLPVISHCEDLDLLRREYERGSHVYQTWLTGNLPSIAESVMCQGYSACRVQ